MPVLEEDSKDIITAAHCIRETHGQTSSSKKLLSSKARSRSADRLLDNEKRGRMPPAKNFFKTLLRKGEQIKYL